MGDLQFGALDGVIVGGEWDCQVFDDDSITPVDLVAAPSRAAHGSSRYDDGLPVCQLQTRSGRPKVIGLSPSAVEELAKVCGISTRELATRLPRPDYTRPQRNPGPTMSQTGRRTTTTTLLDTDTGHKTILQSSAITPR